MLLRRYLWLLALAIPCTLYGQQYSVAKVKATTDSIMKSLVGGHIFPSCKLDSNGYYSAKQGRDTTWFILKDSSETRNNVISIYVSYNIHYHYPKCPLYDTAYGITTIELDGRLQLINEPDISFIPEMMLKDEDCHFISKEAALITAKSDGHLEDTKNLRAELVYDKKTKGFYWFINCSVNGELAYLDNTRQLKHMQGTKMEYTNVDAQTNEILEEDSFPSDKNPLNFSDSK